MTEFSERVERQRIILEAEKWAKEVKDIHIHGLNSMWYDDRPEDTEGGKMVIDTAYNNGTITRKQNGKLIQTFGEELTGEALIREYERNTQACVRE